MGYFCKTHNQVTSPAGARLEDDVEFLYFYGHTFAPGDPQHSKARGVEVDANDGGVKVLEGTADFNRQFVGVPSVRVRFPWDRQDKLLQKHKLRAGQVFEGLDVRECDPEGAETFCGVLSKEFGRRGYCQGFDGAFPGVSLPLSIVLCIQRKSAGTSQGYGHQSYSSERHVRPESRCP